MDFDKLRWSDCKYVTFLPQYRFVKQKRKCEYWRNRNNIVYVIERLIYERYKLKYQTDIPASVKIGRGLRIEHLGGIVINVNSVLGENITLLNGVLIGAQNRGNKKGAPIIGNKVWVGTNSVIVGNVIIGNNVLIAPGAYVNFDVPDNSIVIGNPGRIVNNNNATEGYLINTVD